jgi:hypothetical protein
MRTVGATGQEIHHLLPLRPGERTAAPVPAGLVGVVGFGCRSVWHLAVRGFRRCVHARGQRSPVGRAPGSTSARGAHVTVRPALSGRVEGRALSYRARRAAPVIHLPSHTRQ